MTARVLNLTEGFRDEQMRHNAKHGMGFVFNRLFTSWIEDYGFFEKKVQGVNQRKEEKKVDQEAGGIKKPLISKDEDGSCDKD